MKWLLLLLLLFTPFSGGISQTRTGKEALPIATELIVRSEGFRQCAYLPTPNDRWTVGTGFTFRADGSPVKKGDCITQEENDALLAIEIRHLEGMLVSDVKPVLLNRYWRSGLTSFIFNVGYSAYSKSTLRKHLVKQDWNGVCRELAKWNRQAGKELKGLTKRRNDERRLMKCVV
jgi:lysozyme